MRLDDTQPCSADWCYLKRQSPLWPENGVTIWPQEFNTYGGSWSIYIINRGTGHGWHVRKAKFCNDHGKQIFADWEQIAREEVSVYELTCRFHNSGGR